MGIRLPGGDDHQPVLRPVDRTARDGMPGIRPTARSMPGRAAACCPTIWACSTCWGTCTNGCTTGWAKTSVVRPWARGRYHDIIETLEYVSSKNCHVLRGGSFPNLPAFVRSASRNGNTPSDCGQSTSVSAPPELTEKRTKGSAADFGLRLPTPRLELEHPQLYVPSRPKTWLFDPELAVVT